MPIPPAPDDWDRIDKPVLYATARLLARSPAGITSGAVAEAVGQPEPEIQASLGRLKQAKYLDGLGAWGAGVIRVQKLTERGRREVGAWPKEATTRDFLRVLEELADSADGEERSKLERLSSAAHDVGVGTLAGVLSAFIAGQR